MILYEQIDRNIAQRYPFEWQKKENIVYCDYLEHLLLHVLICMYPSEDKIPGVSVGIGGIVTFWFQNLMIYILAGGYKSNMTKKLPRFSGY